MATKNSKTSKTTTNNGRFKKGNTAAKGLKRTAGFKHYAADLFAHLLEDPVSATDPTPFVSAALEKYKKSVLSGKGTFDFVSKVFQADVLNKLDAVLMHQKSADMKYLKYLIFDRAFDEQQQVLLSKKPEIVLICGRRSGKTEALALKMVLTAMTAIPREGGVVKGEVVYIGKSHQSAYEIMWKRLVEIIEYINVPFTAHLTDQTITLGNGIPIYIRGANTIEDIEKLRGHGYLLAVVDEAQSIKNMSYLVEEILSPALRDYKGQLIISGTPPRIPASYIEGLWLKPNEDIVAKFHWDISRNVFIDNYQEELNVIKFERGFKDNDPIYQREYLGRIGVYDKDALVLRFNENNYFTDDEVKNWILSQPITDVKFTAGLDFGYVDADAFSIIMYSETKPEKFLVYEYKARRTGVTELAEAIKKGLKYIKTDPLFLVDLNNNGVFRPLPYNEPPYIFLDPSGAGQKIGQELYTQYGLIVNNALRYDKNGAIELLQEEIRTKRLKVREKGIFYDEGLKIVFSRDEQDNLTRTIDDDTFHPDMLDAVLYALRFVWMTTGQKLGEA